MCSIRHISEQLLPTLLEAIVAVDHGHSRLCRGALDELYLLDNACHTQHMPYTTRYYTNNVTTKLIQ